MAAKTLHSRTVSSATACWEVRVERRPDGKVVVYMGCDERNEYVYKFVSSGTFDAASATVSAVIAAGMAFLAQYPTHGRVGEVVRRRVLPKSLLGQAIDYALAQRQRQIGPGYQRRRAS